MNGFAIGFIDGYHQKTATTKDKLLGLYGTALKDFILPAAILAPLGIGAAAGVVHSKATAPGTLDMSTAQKALEDAELREYLIEIRRQQEDTKRKKAQREQQINDPGERSLHI